MIVLERVAKAVFHTTGITQAQSITRPLARRQLLDRIEAEALVLSANHFPEPGFGRVVRFDGRRVWQALSVSGHRLPSRAVRRGVGQAMGDDTYRSWAALASASVPAQCFAGPGAARTVLRAGASRHIEALSLRSG